MKVQAIWASRTAVVYKIDDKCYFYNREHNEMPHLKTGQEVSASVLGAPYKAITVNGLFPELAFPSDMKKVDRIDQRIQTNQATD